MFLLGHKAFCQQILHYLSLMNGKTIYFLFLSFLNYFALKNYDKTYNSSENTLRFFPSTINIALKKIHVMIRLLVKRDIHIPQITSYIYFSLCYLFFLYSYSLSLQQKLGIYWLFIAGPFIHVEFYKPN